MDWDEIIAQTCRYFGQSPDYWEDALTMRRLGAQQRSLAKEPPPEFFLASYFIGHEWWTPPDDKPAHSPPQPDLNPTLPEFEP